jgi:L-seryl-tRNA(Ser) seleniumtransferase
MLAISVDAVRARADALAVRIGALGGWHASLVPGSSAVGGGSAPGVEVPTVLIALARDGETPDALSIHLRSATPPVIARIENDRVVLDLRTVLEDQDEEILRVCAQPARGRL